MYRTCEAQNINSDILSGEKNEKYYEIIDGRYTSRKITIFTSNYCISRLNYDERITNRILERSLEIPFPEESVREHIAETMKQQMIAGIMGGEK